MVNGAPKTLQYRRADGPYELRLAIQNFVSYYGISQGFGCISEACVAGVIEAELRKRSGVCPKSKYLDLLAKSLRGELHTERLRTAVDAALGFNDLWPSLALTMVQQVAKMKSKTHARTRTHTHTHTRRRRDYVNSSMFIRSAAGLGPMHLVFETNTTCRWTWTRCGGW